MNVYDKHQAVLLRESISALRIKKDGVYIDGTFGRGGHSREILKNLGQQGTLIAIDKDNSAVEYGRNFFKDDNRIEFINSSFTSIGQISKDRNLANNVNGILLDLGVSSPQLDNSDRGFSFNKDGPLDMRMDQKNGIKACEWLNVASEQDISNVIWKYGDERASKMVAAAIVQRRQKQIFTRTLELAELCERIIRKKHINKHPATKVFQAIRIYINNELNDLKDGLKVAFNILAFKGRLVVISFHSIEDRIVKRFMRDKSTDSLPSNIPVYHADVSLEARIVSKKIKPGDDEINDNKRARSAVMRVLEKI